MVQVGFSGMWETFLLEVPPAWGGGSVGALRQEPALPLTHCDLEQFTGPLWESFSLSESRGLIVLTLT